MDMRHALFSLAVAATLSITGCAGTQVSSRGASSAASPSEPSSSQSQSGPEATPGTKSDSGGAAAAAPAQPMGEALDVGDRLPYKGMPATCIDQTWLGPADEMGDQISGGKYNGGTPYYWRARNGTDDLVFAAYVKDSEVAGVAKFNLGKNYWDGGSEYPDLEASGEAVGKHDFAQAAKPDPDGWDDAEDYANANSSYFNSWEEAHDYWLEEMT